MKKLIKMAILATMACFIACNKPQTQAPERPIAKDSDWIREQLEHYLSGKEAPCSNSIQGYVFGLKSLDGKDSLWIEK